MGEVEKEAKDWIGERDQHREANERLVQEDRELKEAQDSIFKIISSKSSTGVGMASNGTLVARGRWLTADSREG